MWTILEMRFSQKSSTLLVKHQYKCIQYQTLFKSSKKGLFDVFILGYCVTGINFNFYKQNYIRFKIFLSVSITYKNFKNYWKLQILKINSVGRDAISFSLLSIKQK